MLYKDLKMKKYTLIKRSRKWNQYKFWVCSSRGFNKKTVVKIPQRYVSEGDIKLKLERWCKDVFPMWNITDRRVEYGYKKVET